jgi:hypothetical protein
LRVVDLQNHLMRGMEDLDRVHYRHDLVLELVIPQMPPVTF